MRWAEGRKKDKESADKRLSNRSDVNCIPGGKGRGRSGSEQLFAEAEEMEGLCEFPKIPSQWR